VQRPAGDEGVRHGRPGFMKVGQDHANLRHDGQHGQLVRDRHPVEMIPRGPEALPKE
jgi:hypothetical protein